MISLMQRYDATDKVFVITLCDNGLDDESVSLLLQLIFALPYLRSLDIRRNCFSTDAVKRIEDQLKTMEGITGVIRTAGQTINVHSGNQLRLSIDISEQMPKDVVAKEIDFTVHQELAHADTDPFLSTEAGRSEHPWTKTSTAQMKSTQAVQQPMPDPSAVDLPKTTAGPAAPVVGGPPVGLGGPGNVAALNKKAQKGRDRLPDPKRRQSRRAKAAPPPDLDHLPDERVVDKWQATMVQRQVDRPSSSAARRSSSQASLRDTGSIAAPPQLAALSDRKTVRALAGPVGSGPLAASIRASMDRAAVVREAMNRSSSMPTVTKQRRGLHG